MFYTRSARALNIFLKSLKCFYGSCLFFLVMFLKWGSMNCQIYLWTLGNVLFLEFNKYIIRKDFTKFKILICFPRELVPLRIRFVIQNKTFYKNYKVPFEHILILGIQNSIKIKIVLGLLNFYQDWGNTLSSTFL